MSEEEKVLNLPREEEKILEFWRANHIFEKTLALRHARGIKVPRPAAKTKPKTFVFYEGPPYANGKPGIHHVLARIYKDIILRYKTMRGYYVPRCAGWDTHGLPVEIAAEKALGLKSKKEIEKFGIKKFNEEAKKAVWVYKDEWERLTERIGYWLDLKNAYVTYEPEYIETLWWTLAQIARRKLLYKGRKVVPWCTRCGTALSSHELALGYKEIKDESAYVKFRLSKWQKIGGYFTTDEDTYILSWTTTPWTLPGNVALAVGRKIKYVVLKKMVDGKIERWIVAEDIVKKEGNIFGFVSDIREVFNGRDLVGLSYEPLFRVRALNMEKAYLIYDADFVNTEDGTGVVHTAVMYGEDDYKLGQKIGLPQHHTVDKEGRFTKDVRELAGMYVKSPETEKKIIDHLTTNRQLLITKPHTHEYPFCWRCGTPVLYYARNSWFIATSKLREKLLAANKKINWNPEHLKTGRFGEWLKEVKDWNLSRERYWGAPLPIWECKKCGKQDVVGSLEELSDLSSGSRNNYLMLRHGEAESYVARILDSGQKEFHLTLKGRIQVEKSVKKLKIDFAKKKEKIDIIIASDILRAKESAEIAAEILGIKKINFDKRLQEIHLGEFTGCHNEDWHKKYPTYESRFARGPEGGESLRDLRKRVWEFIKETEKKYKGKNILLVTHEYSVWMLCHTALGWSEKRAIEEKKLKKGAGEGDFISVGDVQRLNLKIIPRDEFGLVDLHKPFVDEIALNCGKCGGKMRRVKEVADVWYDSGAMPFAQAHWPFAQMENRKWKMKNGNKHSTFNIQHFTGLAYPADYIAEGMDQTRGWFYTMLAVATALGCEAPYKNVVSLGLINDKYGQKMSKSRGNAIEPWEVINKYGADAVRWYFYTINPPGETKNFDELEIVKAGKRFHALLWNSLVFLKTYSKRNPKSEIRNLKSKNILDKWISARLEDAKLKITNNLEKYNVRDAALDLELLADDLSRWYIRRSRRRLQKPKSENDFEAASSTLGYAIYEIAKLSAPFVPFFAEILRKKLFGNKSGENESIHMDEWPTSEAGSWRREAGIIKAMAEVRRIASVALAKRAEAGIKVRQPLAELRIKRQATNNKLDPELLEILKDEVNVKYVAFNNKLKNEIELDTTITPELKEEGILRELVRTIQELRQKAGLMPKDKIVVMLETKEQLRGIVLRNESLFKKEVGAKAIEYKKSKFEAEEETKIEGENIWLGVRKI